MKRTLSIVLLLAAVAACAPQSEQRAGPAVLDPCTNEYIDAFTSGRRLQDVAGCVWSDLVDQARSDRIQAQIASRHPAGGKRVGFKVTSAADGRVVGVITERMLLSSGSTIDLSTGSRLLGESDVLVRVKSAAINDATTLEQVAAEIDAVIPFIESSDMMLPQGSERTKSIWTASNGNARWGVRGKEIDVSDMNPQAVVALLGSLEVELIDETGQSLQKSAMRTNPLQSVIAVIEDFRRRDEGLLASGDLISLGNFGRPRFPKSGARYTAVFHGLAEPAPRVIANYD